MRKMKYYFIILSFLLLSCCTGCESYNKKGASELPESQIIIVYDNDVHCAVDGYAKLAGLREQQRMHTPYVTTVSCGDFVQGDVVGSVSQGEKIVDIMNQVGYDVVTLGNHEFDFGMSQLFKLTDALEASVTCANFRDIRADKQPFTAYRIIRYGDVDIAYIGFTTTTTFTKVSPKTFQDESGTIIYDFMQADFYQRAQRCIDEARAEGADYVIALSHLGDMDRGEHASSIALIRNTVGLDVVLDGHDHHVIPDTLVHNQQGKPVLLASTGTKFANVGLLTLSTEGEFTSRLVATEETSADKEVQMFVDEIKEKALADGRRVVGYNEVDLSIYDEKGNRLVRSQETPIGNFCADAFRKILNTDVAMINGGGIRSDILQGELTFNHLMAVFPFNNTACTATMTGQQLLDALELSVSFLPEEDGTFMQVSGVKFNVDTSVPSPVVWDDKGLFSRVGDGKRRVSNLLVLDRMTGGYWPVDLNRNYTLASFDYQLKELGCSGIFRYAGLKEDNLAQDVEVLSIYIERALNGRIGQQYADVEGRIQIK